MDPNDNQKGVPAQPGVGAPQPDSTPASDDRTSADPSGDHFADAYEAAATTRAGVLVTPAEGAVARVATKTGSITPPPPSSPPAAEEGDEDEGMLRMSFMEHLEELRFRILRALMGLGVAFVACLYWSNDLWAVVSRPATAALTALGMQPYLYFTDPMESFSTIWVKLPMLASIFLASPWILYQVWAFIAPGLYKKERRWAAPFVITSSLLFILGGLFAYFIAFRYGLIFLLGIGLDVHVKPWITITQYFDLFVNITLGIGLVFEMPILIFFLILLRLVTPSFLINHSRYAILIITIIAAVVTPTPDVYNMMLFATPMCLLYFVGVFAGWLLVKTRETGRFPWAMLALVVSSPLVLMAIGAAVAVLRYGFKLVPYWPFLVK